MAVPDKKKPDTAVRVESGDTLNAIARANDLTLKQLLDLNPKFTTDPKYQGGNKIFSNTLVNIKPATTDKTSVGSIDYTVPSSGGFNEGPDAARAAAEAEARRKAEEEARLKAEAEARAKAAQDALIKAQADAAAAAGANNAIALANAQAALAAAQATANAATAAAATAAQTAAQNAAATAAATAAAEAEKVAAQRESIGKIVADRFAQYGLASLGAKVLELARAGYTEATITLELQNTDEYKTRFSARK